MIVLYSDRSFLSINNVNKLCMMSLLQEINRIMVKPFYYQVLDYHVDTLSISVIFFATDTLIISLFGY